MIRERDGIHIDAGEKIVADSRSSTGDINLVSHAHFDHIHQGDATVLCSELTASLTSARTGNDVDYIDSHDNIELLPSGHILGSRAALIEGDETVLYTGDVSTRDRLYMDGFKPVNADILVVESTYGIPAYEFPTQEKIKKDIKSWIETRDQPILAFGYSLGRAQKLQHLLQEITCRPILVHQKIEEMNNAVEEATDLEFRAKAFTENSEELENGILVAPSSLSRSDWADRIVKEHDAVKAGFSGWAVKDSFRYRGDYDRTFPMSDHCGFEELVSLVREVDPEKVYTHHGFDEAFASYLKKEEGYNARALKNNQSSLTEF